MAVYQELYRSGELRERVGHARDILKDCQLCPRRCRTDRLSGERGMCRIASEAVVSSYGPHFGEEAPLVGIGGSGTIFFSYCNLRCMFCQNYSISQLGQGRVATKAKITMITPATNSFLCLYISVVIFILPFPENTCWSR